MQKVNGMFVNDHKQSTHDVLKINSKLFYCKKNFPNVDVRNILFITTMKN